MKYTSFLLISIFLMAETYAGMFGLPNPIKIAENVAGKVDETAKTVAVGVINEAKKGEKVAEAADQKVVNGTRSVLGKVHNGVFDVENGIVNGVDEVIGTPVDIKEVNFYLATEKNVENPTQIDYYMPENVAQTKGKIYFMVHGWMASRNSSWYHDLSDILLKAHPDAHVVQVNWDKPASDNYALAAFKTESVGNLVGILINRLVSDYKVPSDNIVLIGHSLGGQISGWAAKKFREIAGKTLPRIIALDPAGPLFIHRPDSRRLNKNDAKVVMVVHSDGGKLGYPFACGTIDFFPNGGSNQPGCWTVDLAKVSTYVDPVTCDHSRAWDFFVEAVNATGSFPAKKCENFGNFKKNICEAIEVAMGDLETLAEGSFYLETNSEKPYTKFFKRIVDNIKGDIEKIKQDIDEAKHGFSKQENDDQKSSVSDAQPKSQESGDV